MWKEHLTYSECQDHAGQVAHQNPEGFQVAEVWTVGAVQLGTSGWWRWRIRSLDRQKDHGKADQGRNEPDDVHDRHLGGILE